MTPPLKCLIVALGIAAPACLAAPPPNDAFTSPAVVAGLPVITAGSNVDATLQSGESKPHNSAQASVWFRWVAPTSGAMRIDTIGSNFDTILAVWTGGAIASLSLVDVNDDFDGTISRVFFDAVAGTTYQIAVYGFGAARGTIALHITKDVMAKITGTVTGPDGTTPLKNVQITGYRWDGSQWDPMRGDQTEATGNYTLGSLAAGTYRVKCADGAGTNAYEFYNNAADVNSAADIVVPAATAVRNIHFALALASKITGKVTGPDGLTPLQNIGVKAFRWNGSEWVQIAQRSTDVAGNYTLAGLQAGPYRVSFGIASATYAYEYYPNAAHVNSAADIVVATGTTVANINASLTLSSLITGTVTGPDGTTPLPGLGVTALRWNGSTWDEQGWGSTAAAGNYTLAGLQAGAYRVKFSDGSGTYAYEYYNYYSNATEVSAGTDIVLPPATTVANIHAALALASKISGTVTGPDGTTPLPDINVSAFRWNGSKWDDVSWGGTDAAGNYTLRGLAAGVYRVKFSDAWSGTYAFEFYNNAANVNSGTDIVVAAGATVANIHAALAAPGTYYRDADGDGYGDSSRTAVGASPGFVIAGTDCNDGNPRIHPGAAEVRDMVDNDCDGRIDEGCTALSVTPTRREIGSAGGRTTFAVSRKGGATVRYSAKETLPWLRIVSGARGTNRGKIVVACLANPGDGARTGILTIRATGAVGSPKKVKIVQGGRVKPLLSVTPEIRRVGAAAGRKSFSVSNKGGGTLGYRASESVSWLRISKGARGGNRGTIAISYAANASPSARTGTIRIAASGANGTPTRVKIVQAGKSSSRSLNPAAKAAALADAVDPASVAWPLATARSGASEWTAAPELVDGDDATVWVGEAGEAAWAVSVDFGEVIPLPDLAVVPVGEPRANAGWLGTADLLEWFDLRAITNWPVPCRAVYLDFRDDGSGNAPAIQEIRWGNEDSP